MDWGAIAVAISALTFIATIVGASYTHGKLTQRVDQNGEDIDSLLDVQRDHGEKLAGHDVAIGRLNEWKEGFNAAARVSGGKEHA